MSFATEGRLPGAKRGATSPLAIDGEVVAMWLRTRVGLGLSLFIPGGEPI
jgi:hypothetical protein